MPLFIIQRNAKCQWNFSTYSWKTKLLSKQNKMEAQGKQLISEHMSNMLGYGNSEFLPQIE